MINMMLGITVKILQNILSVILHCKLNNVYILGGLLSNPLW